MPQIVSRRFAAGYDRLEKTRAVRLHDEGNQMYVIIDFHKIDELPGVSVLIWVFDSVDMSASAHSGHDDVERDATLRDQLPVLFSIPVKAEFHKPVITRISPLVQAKRGITPFGCVRGRERA